MRRKPGQALCPALQTKAMLLKKQSTGDGAEGPGGMLWFSALYQGKPNIEGGGQLGKPYRYHTTETNFSGRKFYKTKDGTGRTRESYVNECIYFITADLAIYPCIRLLHRALMRPEAQELAARQLGQRVAQGGQHLGRAAEADRVVLARLRVAQDLDGHVAREASIGRAEDHGARTDAENLEPVVAAAEQVPRARLARVRGENGLEPAA